MSRRSLLLIVRREASGDAVLCAPKVGIVAGAPAAGTLVGPGSPAGTLTQLASRYDLRVPEGVAGSVAAGPRRDRSYPVGYGEEILRVVSASVQVATSVSGASQTEGHHVVAPTDGVFYSASGPGSPPFAPKGARLAAGQTIGLIEVMKTFNPIPYGGGALPESAEVVEVLVGDGEEVRAGQTLLVVR